MVTFTGHLFWQYVTFVCKIEYAFKAKNYIFDTQKDSEIFTLVCYTEILHVVFSFVEVMYFRK